MKSAGPKKIQNSGSPISVEGFFRVEELKEMKSRWDNLLATLDLHVPYFAYEWYVTAMETIDRDKQPFVLFFEHSGKDIGMAPLVCEKRNVFGFNYQRVGFIRNAYTPFQGFIRQKAYDGLLLDLIDYLNRCFGVRYILDLDEVRLSSEERGVIEKLASNGVLSFYEEKKCKSRFLPLKENFDLTLQGLSGDVRNQLKRKIKRIFKLGNIEIQRIRGEYEVCSNLDHFFRFYARTWKGEEPHPEFYYKMCERFERMGRLYFYALNLDGRPIAYLITLAGKSTMYSVKHTYDPAYYAFSPGVVLFYESIKEMLKVPGIAEFDFGRGDEQFKREWTALSRSQSRLSIYPDAAIWQIINHLRYSTLPRMRKSRSFNKVYTKIRSKSAFSSSPSQPRIRSEAEKVCRKVSLDESRQLAMPSSREVRFSQPRDIYRLTAAMSARNLSEVKRKLEGGQRCILILENNQIAAYFWLSPNERTNESKASAVLVDNWGLQDEFTPKAIEEQYFRDVLIHLRAGGLEMNEIILPQKDEKYRSD